LRLLELNIDGVRNLKNQQILATTGINLIVGPNGAGKTSILEAIHILGTGRSFRGSQRADWLNSTEKQAIIFSKMLNADQQHRLGFQRSNTDWQARFNGQDLKTMGELARCIMICAFHPQSHQLVEGDPQQRRQFIDYVLFHVEPSFFLLWRQYKRALNQRNQAIKKRVGQQQIEAWTPQLADLGERIDILRTDFLIEINKLFIDHLNKIAPELTSIHLKLYSGWSKDTELIHALTENLQRDYERGFTQSGPHRADIRIIDDEGRVAHRLSRGQQKSVALALCFAQCQIFIQYKKTKPIILLDDLASELDKNHQLSVMHFLSEVACQTWLTGTDEPLWWAGLPGDNKLFHVEHGDVKAML